MLIMKSNRLEISSLKKVQEIYLLVSSAGKRVQV
jgi:hypothetical protein